MATLRLSSKSQIVVPAEVRQRLGLKPGDRVLLEVEGEYAVLRKLEHSVVDELLALVNPALYRGYAAELERSREEWDEPR